MIQIQLGSRFSMDKHWMDGKSLRVMGKFYVEDGAIVGEYTLSGGNSYLITEKNYDDFELELEVMIGYLYEFRCADSEQYLRERDHHTVPLRYFQVIRAYVAGR